MQHCGIYSARCASRIHGWHRLSGRAHNGRFVSFGWRFIPPTHKFLQRLLYWMQVKICVVSPLRRGQRKFKKQRGCHYNEKTAHQFSAGGQHDAEPCARGGGGGRSSEPRISAEAIDSQKAARWCVEQGLMQADGTSFKPSRHTFRLQVIKAWNDLQAMQKAG